MATRKNSTNPSERRSFLAGLAAASAMSAVPGASAISTLSPHPLGQELEAAWAAERALLSPASGADLEAACNASSRIVQQILELPENSIENLKLKARAFAWCWGDHTKIDIEAYDEDATTDIRLAASIVRGLLAI